MEMKELVACLTTLSVVFVLVASSQVPVKHLYLENELILDLSGSSDEWIIQTDPNHIFYFSFLINDDVDEQQISSSLTIVGVNNPDLLLFPSGENNNLSPFYSTDNAVSIKFKATSLRMNSFHLKVEKAVNCPFNIGGSTSCGRVVDDLSCYCGLFAPRTWVDTKSYCQSYNMKFLSLETYEEDLGVFRAFGGFEVLWIGASDSAIEENFVWDSTGKPMSPGYMGWAPGYPLSTCDATNGDCVAYDISSALPTWKDFPCASNYSGICELQPTNLSNGRSTQQVKLSLREDLIFDLSGSSDEWIISTEPNHIFYFSFITFESPGSLDEQQKEELKSSLSILDVNHPNIQLFPFNAEVLLPFYSIGDTVSIKLIKPTSNLNGLQLKVEKAVPCPFNLGGASSCGRVVDELSCYCATFASRNWAATRDFCRANNMDFVSIDTYEEDLALFTAFGGVETLWIGASDTAIEGKWVWDSTGKPISPGYMGWTPGYPRSSCGTSSYDCAYISTKFPAWVDASCSGGLGGICELQPANSSNL